MKKFSLVVQEETEIHRGFASRAKICEGMGFSRLVRFDQTTAIVVCNGERNLGRVSKLLRGAGVAPPPHTLTRDPSVVWGLSPGCAHLYKPKIVGCLENPTENRGL